ncbi:MAG: CRISPR-associated protein Cas4 [Candidatus Methylomirabilis sp.]|nr:CRISPR-associated protein Cas4 [Deltaproteobacteria bacterium]
MYEEADLLPISALQHLSYCERQWALIHLEGLWGESRATVEGARLHEKTEEYGAEVRGDVRIARGLRLRSLRLGLAGVADVVEFHPPPGESAGGPAPPAGMRVRRPYPVEYKRGRPKVEPHDEVQLCAQALCLEEMLSISVPEGALFYGKPRRRKEVSFDAELRARTEALAARLHALARAGRTPPAVYEPAKCDRCSLLDQCLPRSAGGGRSAAAFLADALAAEGDEA